jgi:hypothetical protein
MVIGITKCKECPFTKEGSEHGGYFTTCRFIEGYSTIEKYGVREDCPLKVFDEISVKLIERRN